VSRREAAGERVEPSGASPKRELVVPDDTPASWCKTEAMSRSRLSFFVAIGL
jgi:hypothetical protein